MTCPISRLRQVNREAIRNDGDYVLYWMIAQRRCQWNFALDHAVGQARRLGKPLLILEALRCGYEWANDRHHTFVIDGMAANARRLESSPASYYAYIEDRAGAGSGLLEALARRACLVISDEYPTFFLPRMLEAAGRRLPVRLDAVDSNGLLPMAATDRVYNRAVDLRRFLQKRLPEHLLDMPCADPFDTSGSEVTALPELPPLENSLPEILQRWPNWAPRLIADEKPDLATLPIDHGVTSVAESGGAEAASARLENFLRTRLGRYQEGRLDLENPSTSALSPYLHFGHISPHQIFCQLAAHEGWQPDALSSTTRGQREGWWGMGENAESFLDEFVTWRELGFNSCRHLPDYDQYRSLPPWARLTLEEHLGDPRAHIYDLEAFEAADTHDDLWNAAQRELVRDGRIHNYLRMLWGKKIFEWSPTPEDALGIMIELNNKYATDGRDPNSYSGIFWCLGRHDRAWGPERPIYGKVRYMTSDSAKRKLKMGTYLERYGVSGSRRRPGEQLQMRMG